ncbi:hypothetical protein BMF94_5412 [Rhodotorula taiwanensis]|uniref:RING-CH-type domain-containing protein n=1 Tax=Rhodotorula taiwanensis TaxID=741276 RepID=A0A2S5B448_9BASI|nr:hypothetical protein BMF94_5412 [Rhodotorula taiwanensis]
MASEQVPTLARRQRSPSQQSDSLYAAPATDGETLVVDLPFTFDDNGAHARAPPRRTVSIDTTDKTCWICYTSQSEDPSQPFIHPCACTLLAHPDCLLEWLQTQQSTSPTAQRRGPHCPACGTAIQIHQDKSDLLRWYRSFRRHMDRASIAAGVGGVAASAWFVSAAYGAWALKTFMGDQVTQTLLLRHENGLPWRYWLNLPLIPISLVLSRTPLIDSLLPFLPLTLVLSTQTHAPLFDPVGIDDLSLRWPPSPTLTVCLLPWLRLLYLRLRYKVFRAVLGRRKQFRGLAGVFEEAAMDELASAELGEEVGRGDMVGIVATFEVEPEEGDAPGTATGARRTQGAGEEAGGQGGPQAAVPQAQADQEDPPVAANLANGGESVRLRVGLGRLTSLVLGALLFPALSSLAGSALFWLAARPSSARPFRLLRRLLGITAVLAASSTNRSVTRAAGSPYGLGWIRALTQATTFRASPNPVVDPKWIRNTIGAGLVLLTRDAVELVAGVLDNRRKASRRIIERPFRPRAGSATLSAATARRNSGGAGILQGDDEPRQEAEAMSGGQNQQGRPAVVHDFL